MRTVSITILLLVLLASCKGEDEKGKAIKATERKLDSVAVDVAVWGMPIVSTYSMRQAFFRDAHAKYGDLVYLSKQPDWKFRIATPSPCVLYAYLAFNTKDGPVVIEVPATGQIGFFGSFYNAWQVPLVTTGPTGIDSGKGVKLLILPPGYEEKPPEGYTPVHFDTYNGYALLRFLSFDDPEVDERSTALTKKVRIYPLSQAANPPAMNYIDMSGKLFDGIVYFDAGYYDNLAAILKEEPVLPIDTDMVAPLQQLGISKEAPFKPDSPKRKLLTAAINHAHTSLMKRISVEGPLFYINGAWRMSSAVGRQTGFSFEVNNRLDAGSRGSAGFFGTALPRSIGGTSFYLVAFFDDDGDRLKGEFSYYLHIPPKVPTSDAWAVVAYDAQTSTFIRDAPVVFLASYDEKLKKNRDGSVDIFFGPAPPEGKIANWIATAPGKPWFVIFRLFGVHQPFSSETWKLPDVKKTRR